MFQPIHYSMILNVIALLMAGALSWHTNQPLWLIVVIILQTHVFERYDKNKDDDEENDEENEPAIGFTANIK